MKILNLYAGIGGNRKLWDGSHSVTAVEICPDIARVYKEFYPHDTVVVGDAHEYLLKHFKEFDFIWASPPCQTHSVLNQCANGSRHHPYRYPDMKLWQEIIFLRHFKKTGFWVVENVKPYYIPFLQPDFALGRHYFWSNGMVLDNKLNDRRDKEFTTCVIGDWQKIHGFDLSRYALPNKRQVLRNCVSPEIGKYVFDGLTQGV